MVSGTKGDQPRKEIEIGPLPSDTLDEIFAAVHVDPKKLDQRDRACQNRLKLDKKLRRRVNKLEEVLARKPEKAFAALARLRASFVVSVPGLL